MNAKKSLSALAVIAVLAAAAGLIICHTFIWSGFSGNEAKWIYVEAGATNDDVKSALKNGLGTAGSRAAFLWSLFGGDPAKANGAFLIKPGTSPVKIYRTVKNGIQTPVRITFNNLRSVTQLASRVASKMETDSASFMSACDSILPPRGYKKAEYAAAFLPDTYEFYWTASPEKVVATLADYRDRFWNEQRRSKAKSVGLTPVQVATVASIAEEETNSQSERGTVARLYINRLRKGMKLQADPTVKFALGDFSIRRITGAHLNVKSPYNTYLNAGLPPGPIRIVDAKTLDAVLNSKPHNYLYMCAKEDFSGRHNFAADFAGHQINARRYHRALNARNIK